MRIGIQIALAGAVATHRVGKGCDGLRVARGTAAAVVGRAVLNAVTVNVHVDELAVFALQIDDVVVLHVVAAVVEVCRIPQQHMLDNHVEVMGQTLGLGSCGLCRWAREQSYFLNHPGCCGSHRREYCGIVVGLERCRRSF